MTHVPDVGNALPLFGADMAALHDREPAILHPDEWEPYLAGRLDHDLAEPVGAGTLRLSKEDGFDGRRGC